MKKLFLCGVGFILGSTLLHGLEIEADSGKLSQNCNVVQDEKATGGSCVEFSCHKRIDNPSTMEPSATYTFELPETTCTQISFRVFADSPGCDSVHVSIDNAPYKTIDAGKIGQWNEVTLPLSELKAGQHSIKFWPRESGYKLDLIRIGHAELLPASAAKLYPPPTILPPSGHPRLLCRASDIPMLLKRVEQGDNLPVWTLLKQKAFSEVSGTLTKKDKSRYGIYNENVLYTIQAKAFYFLLKGDKKIGSEAVSAMDNYLKTVKIEESVQDVTRPMGFMVYTMALVYDWCFPLMNNDQRKFFIMRSEEIASTMEVGCPPVKQGNITGHAGEAQIMRDLLSLGVAIYDEKPTMYLVCAGRFLADMVPPRNFDASAGRHHQGACYGPYRYMWGLHAGWIFRRMANKEVFKPSIGDMIMSWLYSRTPDGSFLPDGDMFLPRGTYMKFPEAVLYNYTYTNNARSKAEFFEQGGKQYALNDPVLFLLLNDPALKENYATKDLPLTHYFEFPLGSMIARSGWGTGRTANTAVVEMKGAGYLFNNHQHPDAGAFQIYYKGPLAIDPGQYGKYGTPYDWCFNKQSISHNVVRVYDPNEKFPNMCVNDGGQRHPANMSESNYLSDLLKNGYEVGSTVAHAFGPNKELPLYSHIKGNLKKAYSDKISDYTRSFVYFNLNRDDFPVALVVFDHVVSSNAEFVKYWTMHSYQKPDVTANCVSITIDREGYSGKLELLPLLPIQNNRKIVVSPSTEFLGKSFTPPIPRDLSGQSSRLEIIPVNPARENLFLNVLFIGNIGAKLDIPVKLQQGSGIVGVQVLDRLAFFAADGKLLENKVTFQVEKNNTQVLLTDLAVGYWDILLNDRIFATEKVVNDNHTLFFMAPNAGTWSVKMTKQKSSTLPDYNMLKAVPGVSVAGVMLNGKLLTLEAKPFRENKVLYVPIEPIAAVSGAVCHEKDDILTMKIGKEKFVMRNGSRIVMDDPAKFSCSDPIVKRGKTWYAPSAMLKHSLGYEYTADEGGLMATFRSPTVSKSEIIIVATECSPNCQMTIDNAVDGNSQSYWADNSSPSIFSFYLGADKQLKYVDIEWFHGEDRISSFELQSSIDGQNFTTIYSGKSNMKNGVERYTLKHAVKTRYLRFIGLGNNKNSWNSICEIKLFSK